MNKVELTVTVGDKIIHRSIDEDGEPFEMITEPVNWSEQSDEDKASIERSMIDMAQHKCWGSYKNMSYGDIDYISIPDRRWLKREMKVRKDVDLLLKQALGFLNRIYLDNEEDEPDSVGHNFYFDEILSDQIAMHILYNIALKSKDRALMIRIVKAEILPKLFELKLNKLIKDLTL